MKKFVIFFALFIGVFFIFKKFFREKSSTQQVQKILSTVVEADIKSLDPIEANDYYVACEAAKVYESLYSYHYLKKPYEVVPNLAAAMPIITENGLVYTIKIRENVMFQDNACFPDGKGRILTAYDFVYSWKRLADPKLQSTAFFIFEDKIKGLDEWREKSSTATATNYDEDIEGIRALDEQTLQIILKKSSPQFLYNLAMIPCAAVPHEAVTYYKKEFLNHPVGTGPFIVKDYNANSKKIVYHKNPTFRDKYFPSEAAEEYKHMLVYAGKKIPFVDKVVTYIMPEEQSRWLQFQKNKLDIFNISKTSMVFELIKDKKLVPEMTKKGVQLFASTANATSYWAMNTHHEIFKNVKLRRAIAMAFDKEKNNQLFRNNLATVDASHIPPGMKGYWIKHVENPYNQYNLQEAKKLLAEAGYPKGEGLPEIILDVGQSTRSKEGGEFFQQCMQKLGIKVKVIPNLFPALLKKMHSKSTMIHAIAWSADYPDAKTFYDLFYGPYQEAGGIGINYHNPVFDDLYSQANTLQDTPERQQLYQKMNELLGNEVPAIVIEHIKHLVLSHGWIKNLIFSDFHYGTEQYIDIDFEKKQSMLKK